MGAIRYSFDPVPIIPMGAIRYNCPIRLPIIPMEAIRYSGPIRLVPTIYYLQKI